MEWDMRMIYAIVLCFRIDSISVYQFKSNQIDFFKFRKHGPYQKRKTSTL